MDFIIQNHGSILILIPVSDEGKAWIRKYIDGPDVQYFGRGVVIEPRYFGPIAEGIENDGLTIQP